MTIKSKCECPEEGFVPVSRQDMYSEEEKSGMRLKKKREDNG